VNLYYAKDYSMLQPSETETCSVVTEIIVLLFDRTWDLDRKLAAAKLQSQMIGDLRLVLNSLREPRKTHVLTENVQQDCERVMELSSELSGLREELTAERLLTARFKDNLDSAAVSQG